MKEWLLKHRNEILVSIITAVIMGIINYIWKIFIDELPVAGNSVLNAIKNSIYYVASRQNSSSSSFNLIVLSGGLLAGVVMSAFLLFFMDSKSAKSLRKIQQEIKDLEKRGATDEERKALAKKINETVYSQKHKRGKSPIILLLLLFLCIIYFYMYIIYPLSLRNSFENDTIQIKPYIQETEMDLLCSKWTLMHTSQDYGEIQSYILKIKKNNGLI